MSQLGDFLKADNGKFSTIRLGLLLYVAGVLFVWAYLSISSKTIQKLDSSIITGLGLLTGGKVIENVSEGKTESPTP